MAENIGRVLVMGIWVAFFALFGAPKWEALAFATVIAYLAIPVRPTPALHPYQEGR